MPIALRDLVETMKVLDPTLQYLTPAQTVCNYVNLLFRNASYLPERGRRERNLAAVRPDHHAAGTEQRDRPVRRLRRAAAART